MKKDEIYNKLLEKVQREGGYSKISPVNVKTIDGEELVVCAVFEGTDESSPLKLITNEFITYDIHDYLITYYINQLRLAL